MITSARLVPLRCTHEIAVPIGFADAIAAILLTAASRFGGMQYSGLGVDRPVIHHGHHVTDLRRAAAPSRVFTSTWCPPVETDAVVLGDGCGAAGIHLNWGAR